MKTRGMSIEKSVSLFVFQLTAMTLVVFAGHYFAGVHGGWFLMFCAQWLIGVYLLPYIGSDRKPEYVFWILSTLTGVTGGLALAAGTWGESVASGVFVMQLLYVIVRAARSLL